MKFRKYVRRGPRRTVSLDQPLSLYQPSSKTLLSTIANPRSRNPAEEEAEPAAESAAAEGVRAAVATMSERYQLVVTQAFVFGTADRVTGELLGLDRSSVAHCRRRAIRCLRAMLSPGNGNEVAGVAFIQAAPFRTAHAAAQLAERIGRDRSYLNVLLAFAVPGVRDLRGTKKDARRAS